MRSGEINNPLIFTTCKPFDDEFSVFQKNAVGSWRAAGFDVLVIGDDAGSKQFAHETGCHFSPVVERSEKGIPLIHSLWETAFAFSDHTLVCYVNADIVFSPETARNLKRFCEYPRHPQNFLFVARRRSLPMFEEIPFHLSNWAEKLSTLDKQTGVWDPDYAIDLFLLNKGWLKDVPKMTVGRAGWDNWMLQSAQKKKITVIDGTHDCALLHPNHGYGAAGGVDAVTTGKEAAENRKQLDGTSATISSCSSYYWKDSKLVPCSMQENAQFKEDPSRRLTSDLKWVQFNHEKSIGDLQNNLRTLLWRCNEWVPPRIQNLPPEKLFQNLEATQSLSLTSPIRALLELQTCLAEPFTDWMNSRLEAGRDFYVWGTGNASNQFCSFLKHIGTEVAGYVDGTIQVEQATTKQFWGEQKPIKTANQALTEFRSSRRKPFFYIASVYREEIMPALASAGALEGEDYF